MGKVGRKGTYHHAGNEECEVESSVAADGANRTIQQLIDPKRRRRYKKEHRKLQTYKECQEDLSDRSK